MILLSARAGEESRIEGMAAGADDYLVKPFSGNELLARVETALQLRRVRNEARAQFETLLNAAPLGVYLVDADFRIRQANPKATPVFGNIPDLIGRDFDEVIHKLWPREAADEVVRRFRHTLETGESYGQLEYSSGGRTGRERNITHGGSTVYRFPTDGSAWCDLQDISAQVSDREEIERSEERFRAFVTATSDVIYQMSPDWSEMRQLEGRDFIPDTTDPSRSWMDRYIHPDDREMVWRAIAEAIRSKTMFELEHRVVRVDGSLGWTNPGLCRG